MIHTNHAYLPSNAIFEKNIYRSVMEQARDIILLMSSEGEILYGNQAALDAYQYSHEELKSMCITDLRLPETAVNVHSQMKIAQKRGLLFRTVHVRKNKTTFSVEVSSRKCQFGEKELIISIIRDISQMSHIEEMLKKSEHQYHSTNEELSAAYEELLASEEELRQQFDELLTRDQELQRKNFLLYSLHESVLHLMNHTNSEDILQEILGSATTLAQTSHGFIYRFDEEKNQFYQSHGLGTHACCIGLSFPFDQGIAGKVYQTKGTVVANHYSAYKVTTPPPFSIDFSFKEHGFSFDSVSALLLVPLKSGQEVIGIIGLAHYEIQRNFTKEEIEALGQFANMASLTIANTSLLRSYQDEITERQTTERELRKLQSANQALLNSIPDPLFILNHEGEFVDYKAHQENLFIEPDQFLGKSIFDVFPADIAELTMESIHHALVNKTLQTFEYQLPLDGKIHYYEVRLVPNGSKEVLAMIRDITDRYHIEEQLRYNGMHDSLTDVYNRTYFEEHMKRSAKKYHRSTGLMICDVDGLKLINDTTGHAAGDVVLKHVAMILKGSFGPKDVVARIGGDEFAILLYDQTEKDFETTCCHIRDQLQIYNQENIMFPISVSIGYAISKENPPDMESLFQEADTNMYREKLHQKQSAKSAIVQALVKALEARDYLTEGHGDRLQDLVEDFSKSIGLPERQIADLRLLAHFHDIGKVGIPDNILFKPGRLSEDEWVIMRQHTEIGYRIASSVSDLSPIADWILSHHEHWNGGGYPQGISGENIPLACRILALADTYDAMTNDRPYRKAVAPEEAFIELRKFAGIQFDPVLTTQFINLLSSNPMK
ncbi:diguanylate cyclase domain-containing protein [Pelosinus sp. sgz500959]|uniref:diguanylate cyclase domain-containing protein n=1 Tax=Pelosinus sp. sgz500959 TaxID=3242472 RepID=UPI003670626C